jgi:Ca2+-binding RTX toxin-like protein
VLSGGAGNDRLYGGLGNDTLTGGAGNDVFVFNTALNAASNRDTISDFANASGNNDTIWLENAVFTKLTATGALNGNFFHLGAAAGDANDYIVYNKATGALYYDADGSGAGHAVQIATLTSHPALTASDFTVI